MSDLLSDKKTKQLCVKYLAWDEPVSDRDLELIKPLFKAEAKKLMEWLDNLIWGGVQKGNDQVTITLKFWKSLKKELKDG